MNSSSIRFPLFVAAAVVGSLVAFHGTVNAAVVCSEPLEPICIGNDDTYSSEPRIERCQGDVEKFLEETDTYIECLKQQQQAVRDEADRIAENFRSKVENRGN